MAKSQFTKPNVDVRLREKSYLSAGNKADRATKVSSMVELFNHDKKDKLIARNTKTVARNWTASSHDYNQEVVDREKRDVTPKPLVRRPSPVSIALRVPKPYFKEKADNDKTIPDADAKTSLETAKPTQVYNERPSKPVKNTKGPQAGGKLGYKMNTLEQNGVLASTGNTERNSPSRFTTGVGETNQREGVKNPTPVGLNLQKYQRKLPWQAQNGPPMTDNTSGRHSPNDALRSSVNCSEFPNSGERKIHNARNYWEHKLEPKKDLPSRSASPKKLDTSSTLAKPTSSLRPWSSSSSISAPPRPGLSEIKNQKLAIDERLTSGKISQGFSKPSENTSTNRDLNYSTQDRNPGNQLPSVAERLKNFGQISPSRPKPKITGNGAMPSESDTSENTVRFSPNKLPLTGNATRPTVKVYPSDKPQKPVLPMRPRFMTSAAALRPKPYHAEEPQKQDYRPPPKLPEKPDRPPISTTYQFDPNKPPERPEKPQAMTQRLNGRITNEVNPIPKPERTFTFGTADLRPSHIKQAPRHRNVIRVSSDLSTINGPGISQNLSVILSEELRRSTPDVSRKPKEGYEEVTFCGIPAVRSATMQPPRNTKKWTTQHNYEEVEQPTVPNERKALTANYDRIILDNNPPPRPPSLLELSSGYSHLTFEQDLHTTRSKPLPLTSSLQHTKLKKQNSDMTDSISRTNSISKSEQSIEGGNMLRIRDKIRETFTQISKRYEHHRRKMQDDNDDAKSASSSGDEDSDTESDIVKHRQTLDRVRTLQKTYRNTLKYKSLERELSKFEEVTIFEQVLICKIVKDQDGKFSSKVSYRFPAPPPGKTVGDEKALAHFCFPDIDAVEPCEKMPSQSYSFMLTRENGTRKFGYCRRILPPVIGPRYPVVYCLISPLGSFGLYQLILDELEQRHRTSLKRVSVFLESLFVERFPAPGRSIAVDIDEADGSSHFVLRRPYDTRLEHVDLQCLLYEVGVENTIKIFSSLLLERRVIICGKSLGTLTACIYALRALLYPFVWQHVFVPVLPPPMVDLCCSPTPLLIGILETSLEKLRTLPLEEVFILNLSTQEILSSMGDEMEILPRKLQTPLINTLDTYSSDRRGATSQPSYDFAIDYESAERNTVISEAFMHLFVEMIGHYQNHFQQVIQATNTPTGRFGKIHRNFNRVSFYEDVTSRSLRRFLDLFMGMQMFDGFIHSRELANPDYEGLFERRISYHLRNADASQLNFKVIKTKMKKLMQGIGKKK